MSDSISVLTRLMQAAGERHKVLASNIANVDTPFYRAKDVSFSRIMGNELTAAMTTTDPKHLPAPDAVAGGGTIAAQDVQPWADRNNVEMDREVAKMTENALLYQAGTTLLQMKVRMYKNALRTTG